MQVRRSSSKKWIDVFFMLYPADFNDLSATQPFPNSQFTGNGSLFSWTTSDYATRQESEGGHGQEGSQGIVTTRRTWGWRRIWEEKSVLFRTCHSARLAAAPELAAAGVCDAQTRRRTRSAQGHVPARRTHMAAAVPAGRRGREEVPRARVFLPDSGFPSSQVTVWIFGTPIGGS
jgi:hypothetical protein